MADFDSDVSTWKRIDVRAVLDGKVKALAPTLMKRTDGCCLLYRGMVHSFHGESESGKSMVVQAEIAEALKNRRRVLYIDFESDSQTIGNRLELLGAPRDTIGDLLYYFSPDSNPLAAGAMDNEQWENLLSRRYHLAVIDGVTEAFSVFGVGSLDNDSVTKWGREVPRTIARRTGAAVVVIDHVNKDRETRGRFAMGAQAKMSYLTGASYLVEVLEPLGVGMLGRISLRVAKDRPGQVRPQSGPWRKGDRTQPVAVAVIDSKTPGYISYSLEPFEDKVATEPDGLSDTLQIEIIRYLLHEKALAMTDPAKKHPSQNSIVDAMRERGPWSVDRVKRAIKLCDTEKLIRISAPDKKGKPSTFDVTHVGKAFADDATPE